MTPEEWLEICEQAEADFPELHEFLEIWGDNCGAPRSIFRGHLVNLIMSITELYKDGS